VLGEKKSVVPNDVEEEEEEVSTTVPTTCGQVRKGRRVLGKGG
jgi:hypothetical protein